MAQSLTKIVIHVVFSTKNREPLLTATIRNDLFAYIVGILNSLDCITLAINGTEDHVHGLIVMSKTISLSKMMEEMKGGSSRWLNARVGTKGRFAWQAGYGAFSVSESQLPKVVNYIKGQKEHHRKTTFQDELLSLLKKHRIEFDERYLWTRVPCPYRAKTCADTTGNKQEHLRNKVVDCIVKQTKINLCNERFAHSGRCADEYDYTVASWFGTSLGGGGFKAEGSFFNPYFPDFLLDFAPFRTLLDRP